MKSSNHKFVGFLLTLLLSTNVWSKALCQTFYVDDPQSYDWITPQLVNNLNALESFTSSHKDTDYVYSPRKIYQDFKMQAWLERSLQTNKIDASLDGIKRRRWLIHKIMNMLNTPIIRFVLDPLHNLKKEDQPLDKELLAKILVDGPVFHWPEIQNQYFTRKQNKVDLWNHTLFILKAIVITTSIQLGVNSTINAHHQIQHNQGQQVVQSIKNMQFVFDEIEAKLDKDYEQDVRDKK